jgi:hypothetical protein
MRRFFLHFVFLILLGPLSYLSCGDGSAPVTGPSLHDYDNQLYLSWNGLLLELDRYASGYRPCPAPRAAAYMGLAAYEAVVHQIPENNSLQPFLPGLQLPAPDRSLRYHWPTVVNELYAYLMRRYYFHMEFEYEDLYNRIEQIRQQNHAIYRATIPAEEFDRSVDYAQRFGLALYDWSASDQIGHNGFLDPRPDTYDPPQGPGLWQPTVPDMSRALFPQWGLTRTFALQGDEILSRPPLPYSQLFNSLYYTQVFEVYNTVNNARNNGDASAFESRWIAEFWSDDMEGLTFSPAMRYISILNQLVEREDLDMAECAELYAKMGMALNDANVSIWYSKYTYNTERPVTYIRSVVAQTDPAAFSWRTLLDDPNSGANGISPSAPSFPSVHAGFAGAGAQVLSSFFEFQ